MARRTLVSLMAGALVWAATSIISAQQAGPPNQEQPAAPPNVPTEESDSNFAFLKGPKLSKPSGWTFTPSLLYQTAWDDNVLLVTRTSKTSPADLLNIINPRGDLAYRGRHSDFDITYDGAFLLYRDLNQLNSYEQHASTGGSVQLSPHVSAFARNELAVVPTTELLQLVDVPFVRTGAKLDDVQGGLEAQLSNYTAVTLAYTFEWVQFGRTQPLNVLLLGGHSHGGSASLRHRFSDMTTFVTDYSIQHAIITDGHTFDTESADVGLERRIARRTQVSGAVGVSYLAVSALGPSRLGPLYRLGLSHQTRRASVTISYDRTYVPSFGFGGTSQNQEALGTLRIALARRVYAYSDVAWRRNQQFYRNQPGLDSFWVEGAIGYVAQPWMRVEVFYSHANQTIDRPGGLYARDRVGIQVATSKPMRIR